MNAIIQRPAGSPNILCRKSNHDERHDHQRRHLQPEVIGKTVFACDLSSHPGSPPFGPLTAQCSDPREAARFTERTGRAALSVPPLRFTVTPPSFAVVGA